MVRERDEACATLEHLSTYLMTLCQLVSAHVTVYPKIHDSQDRSSRFEAPWKSAFEHAKARYWHPTQVAQQLPAAQAKLAHRKSLSRAFDAVLRSA